MFTRPATGMSMSERIDENRLWTKEIDRCDVMIAWELLAMRLAVLGTFLQLFAHSVLAARFQHDLDRLRRR